MTPIEIFESYISSAKVDSLQGRINSMLGWLDLAREHAAENGFSPIKSELEEIERQTYKVAAKGMMQASEYNRIAGRLELAEHYAKVAREHLTKV